MGKSTGQVALLILLLHCGAVGQGNMPTKEALKKKYEHSGIKEETKKQFGYNQIGGAKDSIILNPFQFINTFVFLGTADFEFNSIAADIEVKTTIPAGYFFYISPLCGTINKMQFYGGIITGGDTGSHGMFSRWMERNKAAIRTKGHSGSSNNEGDFINATNKFNWNKGKYRVHLFKSGYIPGKTIPEKYTRKDLMFTWGEYEHTWVTLEVENLKTHEKVEVGSLAFPGKKLMYSSRNIIFLEHYGQAIYFSKHRPDYPYRIINYKDLPEIKVDIANICVNGKKVKPVSVKTYHSCSVNPNQSKIPMPLPLLSKVYYDKANGIYQYDVGKLQSWQTPEKFHGTNW